MSLEEKMNGTTLFLKFAFPCSEVQKDKFCVINNEEYEFLKVAAYEQRDVGADILNKCYPAGVRRLFETAKKTGLEPWSYENVFYYWTKEHNELIDRGDGNYAVEKLLPHFNDDLKKVLWFREFCKVKEFPVLDVRTLNDKTMIRIERNRWADAPYFSERDLKKLSLGDKIYVHQALAIMKSDQQI